MIMSMTGYGKKETQWEDKRISIEIRALNSKNTDINLRTPSYVRDCLLYTSPSPRDGLLSRMPSSA